MSPAIEFRPEACTEIRSAYLWYERQRPGLGEAFVAELVSLLTRTVGLPKVHPAVGRRTRRALMIGFPYVVL